MTKKLQKIQLIVGAEATVGNMTYRVWRVEGRNVGVEVFNTGTRLDGATISRGPNQTEMTINMLRKKLADHFEFLDGY
jgi:hypothetical protein